MTLFKNILVPVDGSQHAKVAAGIGADLAKLTDAKLTFLHVMSVSGSANVSKELRKLGQVEQILVTEANILEQNANAILDAAVDTARDHGVNSVHRTIAKGNGADEIVGHARAIDCDLIVMGRRGQGILSELLLGSVSHKVTHLAPCPCMTVA